MIDQSTDYGFEGFEANERTIGSKVDDPPKLRLTAPLTDHGGGGGVVSFNASRQSGIPQLGGQQTEMGMIRVEQAEDVRGQTGNPKAEISFMLNDGSGDGDAAMTKPLAFTCDGITRISPGLANSFRALVGGGVSGGGSGLTSPQGRMTLQLQEDGNMVVYDTLLSPWKAVWSIWTGPIP